MSTAFIIKPKVAGMMKITQCLSSRDPTEQSSISHSYVSMSSSEDAGVGHGGDLHWVLNLALVLWPSVECLNDVCERSYEDLHLPRPSVSGSSYEPIFPPTPAVRWGYPGWHLPILPAAEVPHWWRVRLGYPFWCRLFPWIPILQSHPIRAITWRLTYLSPFTHQWFAWLLTHLLLLQLLVMCHPGLWPWVHSLWTWAYSRRGTWWCHSRRFREWFPPARWMTRRLHAEPSMRIAPFICSYKVIILLYGMLGL